MKTKSKVLAALAVVLILAMTGVIIWLSVWVGKEKSAAESSPFSAVLARWDLRRSIWQSIMRDAVRWS